MPIALLLSFCSFIEGLAELVVQNSEDIVRLFEQGNRVRKMASVDKNSGGSRYCSCEGWREVKKKAFYPQIPIAIFSTCAFFSLHAQRTKTYYLRRNACSLRVLEYRTLFI